MKSLRNKLIAAVTMLAVAAVMLTSASFAWYTVSTQGVISGVEVEMQAPDNVEVAIGPEKPGEVALGDATKGQKAWGGTGAYTGVDLVQLAAYDEAAKAFKTINYNTANGRPETDLVAAAKTDAVYDTTTATPEIYKDNTGNICGAGFDFYLRTNKAGTIKIDPSSMEFTKMSKAGGGEVSVTVKVVDLDSNSVIGTWNAVTGTPQAIELTATLGADGYYSRHIKLYAYVNGDDIVAADLDTDSATQPPKMTGSLLITNTGVTPEPEP